ncbi:dienelactone hydrolase family protein [Dichotomicrobium thermohalophilum]|uniref:Dienelactone hydrolase n=1 Tax=Dichotomicrobium thermohalophilum TaxID=933063 RepID=A0A397QBW8_9HYPH|nr:alpha/beta family hydrolase [Dichotomicrobium thermohalophilum]RIA55731.1 dienelactone hydrolase [Dichotomicrobium thermohalophilum]
MILNAQMTVSDDPSNIEEVVIEPMGLPGYLRLPAQPSGLVIFAHGSGSGRNSPRNNYVAEGLGEAGLATLLFDLLTPEEESDRANVFDIPLLSDRLVSAIKWATQDARTKTLPIGLFGASTGAAAALVAAAATQNHRVGAIVSRGGRPDMAACAFQWVKAPTLLIVGGNDPQVLQLNREAYDKLDCEKELMVVPGATHLFEEPGTLDKVIDGAKDWFTRHLAAGKAQEGERA